MSCCDNNRHLKEHIQKLNPVLDRPVEERPSKMKDYQSDYVAGPPNI